MNLPFDVSDWAKSAVVAGVVAAVANQALVWVKEHRRDAKALKLRQEHAALTLAVALERYALACADRVEAMRQGLREVSAYGNPSYARAEVPELVLPAPADWQCLPAALVSRVLVLPMEIRYAEQQVDIQWDHEDPISATEGTIPRVGRLGWDAWNTAIALRQQQGLPDAAPNVDYSAWDFRTCLREAANPASKTVALPPLPTP